MNSAQFFDRTASVLLQPSLYFSHEEDALDFADGATYVAIMGVIGALLSALLLSAGAEHYTPLALVLSLIIGPVGAIVGTFVAASIIHVLARFLGSRKDYESSFSIAAAVAALYPINALLALLGGVGGLAALLWSWWITSEGLSVVHGTDRGSARVVMGGVYAVAALLTAIIG